MASSQTVFLTLWASSIRNTKQNKQTNKKKPETHHPTKKKEKKRDRKEIIQPFFWEICEDYTIVCNSGLERERDKMEK